MSLLTTKDLARAMGGIHPRTCKRWWKMLGVPPDALQANGLHLWTSGACQELLKRWRAYWHARNQDAAAVASLYSGHGKPKGRPVRIGGWSRRRSGKAQLRMRLVFR